MRLKTITAAALTGLMLIVSLAGCAAGPIEPTAETSATASLSALPETPAATTAAPSATPIQPPTETPFTEKPYAFSIDHYKISSVYAELYDASLIELCNDMISAYLNYETSCPVPSEEAAADVWGILNGAFPLFRSDVDTNSIWLDSEKMMYKWTYTSTKEQHAKVISDFEAVIAQIMTCLREGDSDAVKAIALYLALTGRVAYDYGKVVDMTQADPTDYGGYFALTSESGICSSFADAYAYLLCQAGIEAVQASGMNSIDGHAWTLMKLDGKYYYADPTWDIGGLSLAYFGMTAQFRASDLGGNYAENDVNLCSNGDISASQFDITDTRFDELRLNAPYFYGSYEIDRKNNRVIYQKCDDTGSEECYFDLGTDE